MTTGVYLQQCNDVELMAYLGVITQGCQVMNQVCGAIYNILNMHRFVQTVSA